MPQFVGLDVAPKLTSVCVIDETRRRLWCGQCATDTEWTERTVKGHRTCPLLAALPTGQCLAEWYRGTFGVQSTRSRKIGIVALARKLAVALWRFVKQGILLEGAVLSPVR